MIRPKTAKLYCGNLWGSEGLLYTFTGQIMTKCNSSVWLRMEQRVGTEEENRRRVSNVAMMLAMLRECLATQLQFEAQSPREVLDKIRANRFRLWQVQHTDSCPAGPIQELFHHLVLKEVELFHKLLPNPLRQAAADAIACDNNQLYGDLIKTALDPDSKKQAAAREETRMIATDPARRRELLYRYVEQLRCHLSDKAVQEGLDRPFGKGRTKDREKTEGMSIKNWPVVGIYIWEVYDMLLPLYRSTPRIPKSKYAGPKPELAEYPQELLRDIVELFTSEFPDVLNDLTVGDVKSRIQYQLSKLREKKSES